VIHLAPSRAQDRSGEAGFRGHADAAVEQCDISFSPAAILLAEREVMRSREASQGWSPAQKKSAGCKGQGDSFALSDGNPNLTGVMTADRIQLTTGKADVL